jgi:hydroxymethylglutaryl-CoA lyase
VSFSLPDRVTLREVSPRDGLQTIREKLPLEAKVEMIDALSETGLPVIEAGAFVHPKWVPQMADSGEVFERIRRSEGVRYSALIPNKKGYDRAREAGADEFVLFVSASETYSQKNTNKSISEGVEAQREIVEAARAEGLEDRLSADVSMSFGCPYEGDVPVERVVDVVGQMVSLGVKELYLADTTGTGTPKTMVEVLDAVRGAHPEAVLGLHLHDTRGLALSNVLAALDVGITRFDCSTGGIGGGPYAEGATGNVATEDLVYLLDSMGIETGVDLPRLLEAGKRMEQLLGQTLASKMLRAGLPRGWSKKS